MTKIVVAGIDPSLRNFGMSKGTLDLDSGILDLICLDLAETKSAKEKKSVRQNSKDLEGARQLSQALKQFLLDVDIVFVEIPIGSKSARAMASYGICIGVLSQIETSMIQVTPTEVKIAAVGVKTATKQQMIDWAITKYPTAGWLTRKIKGITSFISKNEHLADSVAAIHAGVKLDEFKAIRNIMRKAGK